MRPKLFSSFFSTFHAKRPCPAASEARAVDPGGVAPGAPTVLASGRGIVKSFGGRVVNDVDYFEVRAGEVHALLGENGAGKSTLSKILYGYYRPDAGEIQVRGQSVVIRSPAEARALGIGMVFQSFTLIPAMSVLENVALFMGDLPKVIRRKALDEQIRSIASRYHLPADLSRLAGSLSAGDQQKVEILKQVIAGARVLILDEPTRVLAPPEREGLFATIAELREKGYGVVLISHKLGEVMAAADRITVMRQGRITGVRDRSAINEEELLELMFAERGRPETVHRRAAAFGPPVLQMQDVSTSQKGSAVALRGISLSIRGGEIVGLAGVSGNGQSELGDAILGKCRRRRGEISLGGECTTGWSIARVRRAGVAFVPEDPLAQACIGNLTVAENFALAERRYRRGFGVAWSKVAEDLTSAFSLIGFPAPRPEAPLRSLSGGNIQRVVIAREFSRRPRLILAYYPTRGLDAHSAQAVRARLDAIAKEDTAVLLVSEDLEEMFALSDHIAVLVQGRITHEFKPPEFDAMRIGAAMVGAAGTQTSGPDPDVGREGFACVT